MIWPFLLQTLTASGVAALLLLVKYLFRDKLSPRWQYAVWSLLALRLLIPAGLGGRYALFPWPLWVETLRVMAEDYVPAAEQAARLLFLVYLGGVAVLLCWYLAAYLRLRSALRRGAEAGPERRARLNAVCAAYGLAPCKAVEVQGLPSAFLCGVLSPVLALPAEGETDDKVLLHELLHRRRHDTAAGLLICLLRCLHWCNPLIWYCCDRALNDCEALCDQRVLERLTGEDRRDYGRILLSMADDRFARAPGTSSMANGGAHIKARIASIARFKRYPAGMALVSVCIAVLLGWSCLVGAESAVLPEPPRSGNPWSAAYALAVTRARRATTVAGALDAYAKGLITGNPYYLAMVAPVEEGRALVARLPAETEELSRSGDYEAVSLREAAPGIWEARLAFYEPRDGDRICRLLPVRVAWGDGWEVEPTGPLVPADPYELPPTYAYAASAGAYRAELGLVFRHQVDNTLATQAPAFSQASLDTAPKPDARFERLRFDQDLTLTYLGESPPFRTLAFAFGALPGDWSPGDPPLELSPPMGGDSTGGGNQGDGFSSRTITPGWDGTVTYGGGSSRDPGEGYRPVGYQLDVYEDGQKAETLFLLPEEVAP